ncbi:MAG: signal peptidase [Actinomycetota bacterium]|jgi:signal peptidase II|nr:signal peptidase [Actinomycetota bacterium]
MHDMQIEAGAPLITSPPTNEVTTAPSTPRRLLYLALVIVVVPVYIADQLTKAWAATHLQPGQPRPLVGSVLQLNLTHNSGAAFSIGTGATWILTAIACSVVLFVLVTARRLGSRGWALALGLLLGGALGNLTDRMTRAPGPGRGEVVDFLQLPHYPIFNLADSAIVSAAVIIAVMAFRGISIDGARASDTAKNQPDDEIMTTSQDSPSDVPPNSSTGPGPDA